MSRMVHHPHVHCS